MIVARRGGQPGHRAEGQDPEETEDDDVDADGTEDVVRPAEDEKQPSERLSRFRLETSYCERWSLNLHPGEVQETKDAEGDHGIRGVPGTSPVAVCIDICVSWVYRF